MKSVIFLVGPKGSGKTTIGKAVSKITGIKFLDVEKLLIEYINKNSILDNNLPVHGFDVELKEIKKVLNCEDAVIVEATGSSEYLPAHMNNIRSLYNFIPVKINCPYGICKERISLRGSENNFEISEEEVKLIYEKTADFQFDWFLILDSNIKIDLNKVCSEITDQISKTMEEKGIVSEF